MGLSLGHRIMDSVFLLKINKTVSYLHEKVSSFGLDSRGRCENGITGNLKTFKSNNIPFGYKEHSIKLDSVRLSEAISEKERKVDKKGLSSLDMYMIILKTFKREYMSFVLLTLLILSFEAFVKYRGILYFRLLIGESSDKRSLKAVLPGLLMLVLKAILLLSETHIKYYILRVKVRVMGAINGVSLLRLSKSKVRLESESSSGSEKNGGESVPNVAKSNISRYQNVISVDSDFSESAISYSIRIFIFPLKLLSSFAVAAVTFDEKALKLLIVILSTLFMLAVASLFISTLFKRPFIAYREKRIAESTSVIENSRSLILTQDHIISSYHDLLSGTRRDEMYYGSFRKYFFTLEEIISRSMGFVCYGIVTVYVWYNHFDVLKSIEMIVNAAWLVPSFYSPLQEVCYLIYYVSEGLNALSRLANLMQITRSQNDSSSGGRSINSEGGSNGTESKSLISVSQDELISVDIAESHGRKTLPRNITLEYGVPVIVSSNDISHGNHMSELLRTVIFGKRSKSGVKLTLFTNLSRNANCGDEAPSPLDDSRKDCGGLGANLLNESVELPSSRLKSPSGGCSDGKVRYLDSLSDVLNQVCYVPQETWVTDGMSLSDIILNGRRFDLDSWNKAIEVCDLNKDLLSWGISNHESARSKIFSQVQFSRGQKIRLALCRAIYGIGVTGELENKEEAHDLRKRESLPPILLLDSIFSGLDPPICCNIFSKLFNRVDGLLMNSFSVVVLSTHMLTFLPKNILESSIHLVPVEGGSLIDEGTTPRESGNSPSKSSGNNNTSASINSIINDYWFESDLSRDLWEISTEEDEEVVMPDSGGVSNDGHRAVCGCSSGDRRVVFSNSNRSDDSEFCHVPKRLSRTESTEGSIQETETRQYVSSDSTKNCSNNETPAGERLRDYVVPSVKDESSVTLSGEDKTVEKKELLCTNGSICVEDKYSTCFYYILKAANKYKYSKDWNGFSKIKESSMGIMVYLTFLVLPQLLLVFGEKFLLGKLASDAVILNETYSSNMLLGIDFWYLTYLALIILAIAIVAANGYLEVSVGLRAANNMHNSFLLGYISSKLSSCIRSLPVSFVLNRLSLDQLTIDYCTTKRVGQFTTAVNRLMGAVYLSFLASEYPLIYLILFTLFIAALYRFVLRYFIVSCRLLHNVYISEVSPLVDIVRNICDGKESLQPQKLDNFHLENGYKQLQEVMRPVLIQSSLETWLKLRLQVGILIPTTFLNMISSYFSDRNSKILIALVIATTYSSLSRIDEIVRYWMRLEKELVSVERVRKYIQLIKNDNLARVAEEESSELNNPRGNTNNTGSKDKHDRKKREGLVTLSAKSCGAGAHTCQRNNVILDSVYGFHSVISSENQNFQLDRSEVRGTVIKKSCCLRNISAVASKGDIIGVVGRSGSGKTSLLYLIARSLNHSGRVQHKFSNECVDKIANHHMLSCATCKDNTDDQILSMFLRDHGKARGIAMLPIEVYFNENTTIRRSIDPLSRYSNENIVSALNVCGVSSFLVDKLLLNLSSNGRSSVDESTPFVNRDTQKLLNICLEKTIGELALSMQVQRILLFTHFFLKRSDINVLLIDEPPVIYSSSLQEPDKGTCSSSNNRYKKSSSLIPNIIFKYFSHAITFIVAHDIRNLNGIKEFWYLHQGTLTVKKL